MSLPVADLQALAALFLLLLLPGLAVVAAPWPTVPFLSLAFWLGTWAWASALGGSREAFVHVALWCFAALCALRLLKPLAASRPAPATLTVLALAVAALLPFAVLRVDAGARAPEQALQALLLVAHDGWPSSRAPFDPSLPFSVPDGVTLVAADVATLAHVPAWRATLLVGLVARGLLLLALFFFLRRLDTRAPGPMALFAWALCATLPLGTPPGLELAAAYVLVALALLARGCARAPAVAAGACAAAGWICSPGWSLLVLAPGLAWSLRAWARSDASRDKRVLPARLWAAAFGLVAFAGPGLARGFSAGLAADARAGLGVALVLVLALPVLARLADRYALAATLSTLTLAALAGGGAVCRPLFSRGPATSLNDDDVRAMEFLRAHAAPLEAVRVDDPLRAAWLPAVAERAVCPPGGTRSCPWRYLRKPIPELANGRLAFDGNTLQIIELK